MAIDESERPSVRFEALVKRRLRVTKLNHYAVSPAEFSVAARRVQTQQSVERDVLLKLLDELWEKR